MLRRVGVVAAGLAMMASVGSLGASAASAASSAVHVEPGSTWRALIYDGGCEAETFWANGTFVSRGIDAGRWSGGGKTISMKWTRGVRGLTFFGGDYTYTKHGDPEYRGKFSIEGYVFKGELAKGSRC